MFLTATLTLGTGRGMHFSIHYRNTAESNNFTLGVMLVLNGLVTA